MNFRTPIQVPSFPFRIHHQHQILSMGSCFAENIGAQLEKLKFQIVQNPFGISYNPISILQNLNRLLTGTEITVNDLFHHNGLWHSRDHHGRFSGTDQDVVLENINAEFSTGMEILLNIDRIILTLGTAFVYIDRENRQVVNNCHKVPADHFERHLLSPDEIIQPILFLLQNLKKLRPDMEVILTVSPVRHLKDGLAANNHSKAVLLTACHQLCDEAKYIHYFPSYEMILDDLRDYRFYSRDLVHPSEEAVEYVWEHFQNAFFADETLKLNKDILALRNAYDHRPLHKDSPEFQPFLEKQLKKVKDLKFKNAFLDLSEEEIYFSTGKKI